MIKDIQIPVFRDNFQDELKILDSFDKITSNRSDPKFIGNLTTRYQCGLDDYIDYFDYVNELIMYLKIQNPIDYKSLRETFILRERLIRIVNPHIRVVYFINPENQEEVVFYSVVEYIDEKGEVVHSDIDLSSLLSQRNGQYQHLDEFLNYEMKTQIQIEVTKYLKNTLAIPPGFNFERDYRVIIENVRSKKIANLFFPQLLDAIEKLDLAELGQINPELFKKLRKIQGLQKNISKGLGKK